MRAGSIPAVFASSQGAMTTDLALPGPSPEDIFVETYAASRYAAYAYKLAFAPDARTTTVYHDRKGKALLDTPEIQEKLKGAITRVVDRNQITLSECLANWLTIATADPDELIGLRIGCCRYCYGENHRYQWREREYEDEVTRIEALNLKGGNLAFPDPQGGFGYRHDREPSPECPECCGEGIERIVARDTSKLSPAAKMLYGGVKQTKQGLEIVMADRVKALENITRMLGGFKDNVNLSSSGGPLVQMAQLVQITDPIEAGRVYEEMMKSLS